MSRAGSRVTISSIIEGEIFHESSNAKLRPCSVNITGTLVLDTPNPGHYDPQFPTISGLKSNIAKMTPKIGIEPKDLPKSPGPGSYSLSGSLDSANRSRSSTRSSTTKFESITHPLDLTPGPGAYNFTLQDKVHMALLQDRNPPRPRTTIDPRNLEIADHYTIDTPITSSPKKLGPGFYFEDLFAKDPRKKLSSATILGRPIVPDADPLLPGPATYSPLISFLSTPINRKYIQKYNLKSKPNHKHKHNNNSQLIDGIWRPRSTVADRIQKTYKSEYSFPKPTPADNILKYKRSNVNTVSHAYNDRPSPGSYMRF